jgi:hypothetical protein
MIKIKIGFFEIIAYCGAILSFLSSLLGMFSPFLKILVTLFALILIVIGLTGILIKQFKKFNWKNLLLGIVNVVLIATVIIISPLATTWGNKLYFTINKFKIEKLFEAENTKGYTKGFYHVGNFNDTNFTAIELFGMLDTRYGFVKIKNGIIDNSTRKRMGRINTFLQKVDKNWYYYNTGN